MQHRLSHRLAAAILLSAALVACGGTREDPSAGEPAPLAGDAGRATPVPEAPNLDADPAGSTAGSAGSQETGAGESPNDGPATAGAPSGSPASQPPAISTSEAEQLLRELDALLDQVDVSLAEDEAAATTMGE